MAKAIKRGARRKPVRKAKQPVAWQNVLRQMILASAVVALLAGI